MIPISMRLPALTSLSAGTARTTRRFTGLVRGHPVIAAATAAVLLTVMALTALMGGGGTASPQAANVSGNFRACLLVSPANATDARLSQASWQGMQDAVRSGGVNAQRIPAPTIDAKAALPYFNGAVQHHCELIVTVGTGMKPATEAAARANPHQEFVIIGATSARPHVAAIAAPDGSTEGLAGRVSTFIANRR
jgi:basic membrane lipoprotein Med (substrate-binding protein (PBP1-ABC) superfamily)